MRRVSFPTLLVTFNAGLLLVALVGLAVAAVRSLGRLADEQALARVDAAGAAALAAIERAGRDAATSAHLLAERPTLARLLREGDAAGLAAFLERFAATGGLDGAAALRDGRPVASGGAPLPWAELGVRERSDGAPALAPGPGGRPLLVAAVPVPDLPGATVGVALALDDAFAAGVGRQVGLATAVLPLAAVEGLDGARGELLATALAGEPAHGRAGGLYVAARPLAGPGGEALGVVQVSMPASGATASLDRFVRRLVRVAVVVAALAVLGSLLVGRALGRPVRELTAAAARVGRGDLATPVAPAPGAELGTLAATMEEMRRRLLAATSELALAKRQSEAILGGIAEGVFTVDRERRIRWLSPQAAALLGIAPEEAAGRFCGDVLRPRERSGARPCEEACPIVHARSRGASRATERLLLPDGSRRSVVVSSSPPAGDQQVQVLRDETAVEAARSLRDAVLANVSHEFKTPLAAQLASIELLRDRLSALPDDEARQLALALERGTLRLVQLVDNLLESVRIEAGEDSIRRAPVALDEVVEAAVELTAPLIAQRRQRLSVDLPWPLPPVEGDAPRLTQVVVNLLANANKFAPPGSAIAVGAAVEPGAVALWVEDEGPGLPAASGRELFARFVRSADEEEPETGGMGLGLAIVESIVARHGGRVEARPGAAGAGTRMCVVLPLDAVGAAAAPPAPRRSRPARTSAG